MTDYNTVCLWFPYLSVETLFHCEPFFKEKPFATFSSKNKKIIIHSVNYVAENMGLKPSISLNEAYTLCPHLTAKKRDVSKEISILKNLIRRGDRFTPLAFIEKPDILILNIKGSIRLFKSKKELLSQVSNYFKETGMTFFLGFGSNPITATAFAKIQAEEKRKSYLSNEINAHKEEKKPFYTVPKKYSFLKKTPVSVLGLSKTELEEIKYLGIDSVHELANIPYNLLALRFSPQLILRLKQIVGIEPELLPYEKKDRQFSKSIRLPEPSGFDEEILITCDKLVKALCSQLKTQNKGTKKLECILYKTDNTLHRFYVRKRELSAESNKFMALIKLKIFQVKINSEIESIRIIACDIDKLFPSQFNLNIENKKNFSFQILEEKEKYENLISHLGNKIGFDQLIYLYPSESHIPEKSTQSISATYCLPSQCWQTPKIYRPILLFKPQQIQIVEYRKIPKIFIWQNRKYNVSIGIGPERISPEWWLDDPNWRTGLRDYWKIESTCGSKLWLFEAKGAEIKGGWFVHGNFI